LAIEVLCYPDPITYDQGLKLQETLVSGKKTGSLRSDYLMILEHPPVITMGSTGSFENVLASEIYLRRRGIELYASDRGGDVTYHGPGQLVGYPIIDLNKYKVDPGWYVRKLEEVLKRTISFFGLEGSIVAHYPGLWVMGKKIAAIGVSIKNGISYHGFALNVRPDLKHFSLIVPCGLKAKGVTSMLSMLGSDCPSTEEVKKVLIDEFLKNFTG
jgi:lipoate-protein ligase B